MSDILKISLVTGVPLSLLADISYEGVEVDEYNRFGDKTGNKIHVRTAHATFPNGRKVDIGTNTSAVIRGYKNFPINYCYDEIGEDTHTVHTTHSMASPADVVVGIIVKGEFGTGTDYEACSQEGVSEAVAGARTLLADKFGYTGDVYLCPIAYVYE